LTKDNKMAQQLLNVGTASGDGTGDTLRTAGQKINGNFTELYGKQLPPTTGNAGKVLATDGTNLSWTTVPGIGNPSASTLTGTILAPNIVTSSLTSIGTLTGLTVTSPIIGSLNGNALTATKLATARKINGIDFDGTSDITIGIYQVDGVNVTGTTLASNVVTSSLTSVGTLTNLTVTNKITGSILGNADGNAGTATKLFTPRNINGVAFDGTASITVTAAASTLTGNTLSSGVTISSLTNLGTLANLAVAGNIVVSGVGSYLTFPDSTQQTTAWTGSAPSAPANALTGTTLASNVVSSSLTSVGTLTNLTTNGLTVNGTTTISRQIAFDTTTYNQSYTTTSTGAINISSGSTGNINNMAIGGTTAAAGTFTTLTAGSTVSGTGFTNLFASPPAIGGTAAASGTFTSLTASSSASLSPSGTVTINPTGLGTINKMSIGQTTPAAGTFTSVLVGTITGPLLSTTAYASITGTSVTAAATYNGVAQLSTSGTGTGATFNITKTGSGTAYAGFTTVTVVALGTGYASGDTITISGALLGGALTTNNLTFTINSPVNTGIGYSTGAGGTASQLTSRTTGVTLNKLTGQITLFSSTLAANTTTSFILTNSTIASTDMVLVQHISGGTLGFYGVTAIAGTGSATISIRNNTGTISSVESPVLQFVVIKAVTA